MHFTRTHFNGNPYLGIFASASDSYLILPPNVSRKTVTEVSRSLEVDYLQTTIAGTELVGTLSVGNSQGLLVPGDATEAEVRRLERELPVKVGVLKTRFNAVGNLILANDRGALVAGVYKAEEVEAISETLGVEVARGTVNSLSIVGSLARTNNVGALVSPKATDEEMRVIKEALDVDVERGTANFGVGNVGTCLLVNSKGAVAGMPTTGIEMGKIQQIFEGE